MKGEEKNLLEVIKDIANPEQVEIKNNSICGKCSCCGECCTTFLPVCQEEINTIQEYVMENNIRPNKVALVMQNLLTCPYYDGKKCMIYEVRPMICKEFYCYKKADLQTISKFKDKEYVTVNMWGIAMEIENQMKEIKK